MQVLQQSQAKEGGKVIEGFVEFMLRYVQTGEAVRLNQVEGGHGGINFTEEVGENELPFHLNWSLKRLANKSYQFEVRPQYVDLHGVTLKVDNQAVLMDFHRLIVSINSHKTQWTISLTKANEILLKHTLNSQLETSINYKLWWRELRESCSLLFQKLIILLSPFMLETLHGGVCDFELWKEDSRTRAIARNICVSMVNTEVLGDINKQLDGVGERGGKGSQAHRMLEFRDKKLEMFKNSRASAMAKMSSTLKLLGLCQPLMVNAGDAPSGADQSKQPLKRSKKNVESVKCIKRVHHRRVIDSGDATHCSIHLGLFELILVNSLYAETCHFMHSRRKMSTDDDEIAQTKQIQLVAKTPDDKNAASIVLSFKNQIRFLTFIRNLRGCDNIATFYLQQIVNIGQGQGQEPANGSNTFHVDYYPYTLREQVQKGIGSILARLTILLQVAQGLNWLVQNGILHRDIKPNNIMIDLNKRVKIIDFGGCCGYTEGQSKSGFVAETNQFLGTEGYHGDYKEYKELPVTCPLSKSAYREHTLFDVFSFGKIMQYVLQDSLLKMDNVGWFLHLFWNRCTSLIPEDRPNFKEIISMLTCMVSHYS